MAGGNLSSTCRVVAEKNAIPSGIEAPTAHQTVFLYPRPLFIGLCEEVNSGIPKSLHVSALHTSTERSSSLLVSTALRWVPPVHRGH